MYDAPLFFLLTVSTFSIPKSIISSALSRNVFVSLCVSYLSPSFKFLRMSKIQLAPPTIDSLDSAHQSHRSTPTWPSHFQLVMPMWTVASLALLAIVLSVKGRLTIDKSTVSFSDFKSCPCPPVSYSLTKYPFISQIQAFFEPVNLRPPGYSTAKPTFVETTFGTSPAVTVGLCALAVIVAIILSVYLYKLVTSVVRCCFWAFEHHRRHFNIGSKLWSKTLPKDEDYVEYADITLI